MQKKKHHSVNDYLTKDEITIWISRSHSPKVYYIWKKNGPKLGKEWKKNWSLLKFLLALTITLATTNYFKRKMKLDFILEMVGYKRPFEEYKQIVSE